MSDAFGGGDAVLVGYDLSELDDLEVGDLTSDLSRRQVAHRWSGRILAADAAQRDVVADVFEALGIDINAVEGAEVPDERRPDLDPNAVDANKLDLNEPTTFELDGWDDHAKQLLERRLTECLVEWQWDDGALVVASDDADLVELILEQVADH